MWKVERPIDDLADRNEKWSTCSGRVGWWPCEKSGNLNYLTTRTNWVNGSYFVKVLGMLKTKAETVSFVFRKYRGALDAKEYGVSILFTNFIYSISPLSIWLNRVICPFERITSNKTLSPNIMPKDASEAQMLATYVGSLINKKGVTKMNIVNRQILECRKKSNKINKKCWTCIILKVWSKNSFF